VLRAEPGNGPVSEHSVQDHEATDRPVDCDTPAISVVRLADGRVERLVVHVEDPRPSGRVELDRPREPSHEQCLDEVVHLLSVRDAGKRRILSADEYASVPHHGDEKTCLTLRQAKRRERSIAFSGWTTRVRLV
jgi:hypothetical protein